MGSGRGTKPCSISGEAMSSMGTSGGPQTSRELNQMSCRHLRSKGNQKTDFITSRAILVELITKRPALRTSFVLVDQLCLLLDQH